MVRKSNKTPCRPQLEYSSFYCHKAVALELPFTEFSHLCTRILEFRDNILHANVQALTFNVLSVRTAEEDPQSIAASHLMKTIERKVDKDRIV